MASVSSATSASEGGKKGPAGVAIAEPKHEKRDSGVAGLDEASDIKILEEPKLALLSPTEAERGFGADKGKLEGGGASQTPEDDDDVETEGEVSEGREDGVDTTEDDEEGVITLIDEVSDSEEKAPPTPSLTKASVSKTARSSLERGVVSSGDQHVVSSTPTRPHSDYSSLVRSTDHTHSPSAGRPLSEHAQLPSSKPHPGIASRFRRRTARAEDVSQLTMGTHDLDITVSPPTPGKSNYVIITLVYPNIIALSIVRVPVTELYNLLQQNSFLSASTKINGPSSSLIDWPAK